MSMIETNWADKMLFSDVKTDFALLSFRNTSNMMEIYEKNLWYAKSTKRIAFLL